MGNETIKINTVVVRNAAVNVNRLNIKINRSFDELTNQISVLNRDWEGSGSDQAMLSYSNMRSDYYENRFSQVNNFVRYLSNLVAEGYDAAENNNRRLSDQFK